MPESSFQRLLTILCLVAFGFGQTVLVSLGVRCTDESGTSRFEYACLKSDEGACLTPCVEPGTHADIDDHGSDPVPPTPCEDEPFGAQVSAAKVVWSSVVPAPDFATVVAAVLWDRWTPGGGESGRSYRPGRDRDRPPDTVARLRSVILIV